MKSATYIVLAFVIGAVLIGIRYVVAPTTADSGAIQIGALTLAVMGLLAKQGDTDSKVGVATTAAVQATTAAVESKAASQENAQSIAAVAEQTSHGLEGVNQKVDGHLGELMNTVRLLAQEVASLRQAAAVNAEQQANATTSEQRLTSAIQTAVSDAAALAPPAHDGIGTTIAGPTTITPMGETTIVMPEGNA